MSVHLLRSSLPIIPNDPFGDAAGLCGTFAVTTPTLSALIFDMDEKSGVHKLRGVLHRKQTDTSTNPRASADGRRKAHSIQAIVDRDCNARADLDGLPQTVTQQRKRQKAVGDGAPEGRFTLGARRVQMNPLPVLSSVGKSLNAILRDYEPICRGKFASFVLFQSIQIINLKRWHRSFS